MFGVEERRLAATIEATLGELGYPPRAVDLRRIPFSGAWGAATSVAKALAAQAAAPEVAAETAGLDKKAARARAAAIQGARAQEIADQLAARLRAEGVADRVEAVNGYVNIYFDTATVARQTIERVRAEGEEYGRGARVGERVMVEFSQPNTHKAFHVGHLRNAALGNALSTILGRAGYDVLRANYIGDIGLHVVKCLWCYRQFHYGEEPAENRGRWLGEVYAESDARLRYRDDVVAFINTLSKEDEAFRLAADRMMKALWREKHTSGEDIAYLLGQLSGGRGELDLAKLHDPDCLLDLWPIIGEQLREEAQPTRPRGPLVDEATARARLAEYAELDEHFASWWAPSAAWPQEVRETFQLWERKDPEFVALWERTKAWSMEEFHRIYHQLGIRFDVWFYESEVEEEGRAIVGELLERDIAEISEGLPVVKIDEKLGLDRERYRVLPILRSDGTTLYSTKDLALTKEKFERYGVDRAIWVVDVRQSLYMQQIFKTLELWGFEQAKNSHHLGYEMVALPEGVISSRKGNVPVYEDVAAEVLRRARAVVEEKNPDLPAAEKARVAEQVGIGALLYGMLDRDNNKLLVFDFDEALSLQGQSAPYIQYAHARACRILERAGGAPEGPPDFGDLTPPEINLIEQIALLPAEVQRAAQEYKPLVIATYAYDLATLVNDFYEKCRVIDAPEPQRSARLALVDAARLALASALGLLGIAAPRAM
ncbi:MAG TPA: arginine--tRNA ligase [Thermomicrobiales bacterium]|nr:arginine--tRNA ligase [Thermomicrobiales bacterium]